MICRQCGAENPEDADICGGCGATFTTGPSGFPDNLVYSISKILRVPDWIVRCLFVASVLCFAIDQAVAIWAVTAGSYEYMSGREHAMAFLDSFLSGVFASGLVAGFALLLASFKRNADQIVDTLVTVFYIEAAACFLMGLAHAILLVQGYPHELYSNTAKAMWLMANFVHYGLVYSMVLFGIAALVSRREDSVGSGWPAGKLLCVVAAIVFLMSIVIASLQVSQMASEENQSWVDLAFMFPYTLMSTGMLYGGIIAGIGGMVLYSSPANPQYYCTNCGKDIFREWKLCPYCGSELHEVD